MRRTRVMHRVARALFVLVSLVAVGCSCGPDSVAELTAAQGIVDRDDATPGDTWRTTIVGETYTWDEAVRTAPDATAALVLGGSSGGGSSGVRMQPGTVIRFDRRALLPANVDPVSGRVQDENRRDDAACAEGDAR